MPIVAPDSESDGGFAQTYSQAGMAQVNSPIIPNPLMTTIAATSGVWNSGLIYSDGYRYLTVALTSSQAGSLVITQYVDTLGLIPRTAVTTAIVGATPLIVDIADLKPFQTFTVSISNTGGSAATVTNLYILLSAG